MSYVDGFVIAIKKKNLSAYRKMANEGKKAWMKHGALQYFECVGDDMHPNMGPVKIENFPHLSKAKSDETVLFSFIIFKSRAHRDAVNKKVMKQMQEDYDEKKDMKMPFDMKKMAYGGFQTIVEK